MASVTLTNNKNRDSIDSFNSEISEIMVDDNLFVLPPPNKFLTQKEADHFDKPKIIGNNFMKTKIFNEASPSDNKVSPMETISKQFQVIWKNVSFSVKDSHRSRIFNIKTRTILNNLSGSFSSGQVTAIMGPSGAGKSTFLEVLACRKSAGLNGWLKVKNTNKLRIAYVPQNNYLMDKLTVYETLKFALRLNNSHLSMVNYDKMNKVISKLGLNNIIDTQVARCSGGQQKRVSIALELFSKPNLLILDEPTTGLDSSSCTLVIKILKDLVRNPIDPMAIVATIHQPSWDIFTQFHNVYIINRRGEHLYLGPPGKLLPLLEKVQLSCDKYNSPPDYIIEIAAEDYGVKPMKLIQREFQGPIMRDQDVDNMDSMEDVQLIRKTPLIKSTFILMERSVVILKRNLKMIAIRIIGIIILSFWLSLTFGHEIGRASGCPKHKIELYNIPLEKLSSMFEEEILLLLQNNCCLFLSLIIGLINGMTSTVLEFPREMHTLMKEYNNGWYSCISFYINKSIMDMPMQVLISSIYILYIYAYTGQPKQYYREAYLLLVTFMVSFASEGMGAAVSAMFMNKPSIAVLVSGCLPLPMILFGGFLVKYSRMPQYMQTVSWFSLMKYAFEAFMVVIYGFDRCNYNYNEFQSQINISTIKKPIWIEYLPLMMDTLNPNYSDPSNVTADMNVEDKAIFMMYSTAFDAIEDSNVITSLIQNRSIIFSYYGIEGDFVFYRSILALVIYLFGIKLLTYFIILYKLRRRI